jgi:hypothetical protein
MGNCSTVASRAGARATRSARPAPSAPTGGDARRGAARELARATRSTAFRDQSRGLRTTGKDGASRGCALGQSDAALALTLL